METFVIKSEKELRGTLCDPNSTIRMAVYNAHTKKTYSQVWKRKKLMNRRVVYVDKNSFISHGGVIVGFDDLSGNPYVYCEEKISPTGTMYLVV